MTASEMHIKSFLDLQFDHSWYVVPAFVDTAVCQTLSMKHLLRELRLRRKTIERIRVTQKPGSHFVCRGTKNRDITCIVLAHSYEELTYEDLLKQLQRLLAGSTDEDFAIIGDGFLMRSDAKDRTDVENGFELLCRALRKIKFKGTVYEPPEYRHYPDVVAQIEERETSTHFIFTPDQVISPSVPPTMLKLRGKPDQGQNDS